PKGQGTVIRGGFGVFVASVGTQGINAPGFSASSTVLAASTTGNLRPAVTLDNPFPTGLQTPTGASLGVNTFLGQSITFFNPNPVNPYSMRWDLDVQRKLGNNMIIEIGYTGNHAIHLPIDKSLNYTPAQYLSTSLIRDDAQNAINTRNAGNVTNPFANLL